MTLSRSGGLLTGMTLLVATAGCPTAKLAVGDREASSSGSPDAAPATGYVDICVGDRHSCAVTTGGAVHCWGTGESGELGAPGVTASSVPVPVTSVTGATQIRCGSSLTCARTRRGDVQCWGDHHMPSATKEPPAPARVDALRGATDLAVIQQGVCAIVGGAVVCDGLALDPAGSAWRDAQRFARSTHKSSLVCVTRAGGKPECASTVNIAREGSTPDAESPPKTTADKPTARSTERKPTPRAFPSASTYPFTLAPMAHPADLTDYAMWGNQPCFLVAGKVTCDSFATPKVTAALAGARATRFLAAGSLDGLLCMQIESGEARCMTWMGSRLDTVASTLGPVRAIDSSDTHACAIRGDGRAACWGQAAAGQLGDGTPYEVTTPTPVLDGVAEIAIGDDLSCARKDSGELRCWGTAEHCERDEKCNPTTKPTLWGTPEPSLAIAVDTPLSTTRICSKGATGWACKWGEWLRVPDVKSPVKSVSGGVLADDGKTWRWAPSNPPAPPEPHFFALAGVRVKALAPDGYCAVTDKEAVVCGHCGVCTKDEAKRILTTVATPHGARAVSSFLYGERGAHGVCVTTAARTLECTNLGEGPPWRRAETQVPMLEGVVESLRDVVQLATAGSIYEQHTACALDGSGVVRCWGDNKLGQLGDGTLVAHPKPAPVIALPPARSIGVGRDHACALTRTGGVLCWGNARRGAVGSGLAVFRETAVGVTDARR